MIEIGRLLEQATRSPKLFRAVGVEKKRSCLRGIVHALQLPHDDPAMRGHARDHCAYDSLARASDC